MPSDKELLRQAMAAGDESVEPGDFDIGFGPATAPDLETDLTRAQDAVAAALTRVRQDAMRDVVSAAVSTDSFKGRIAEALQAGLFPARTTLDAAQTRLQESLVMPLGTTLERTIPLGVVPPSLDGSCTGPDCVAVRAGALAGDLTPAFAVWNRDAFPRRLVRDLQYLSTVNRIEEWLSPVPGAVEQFRQFVRARENESESVAAGAQLAQTPKSGPIPLPGFPPPGGLIPPGLVPPGGVQTIPGGPQGIPPPPTVAIPRGQQPPPGAGGEFVPGVPGVKFPTTPITGPIPSCIPGGSQQVSPGVFLSQGGQAYFYDQATGNVWLLHPGLLPATLVDCTGQQPIPPGGPPPSIPPSPPPCPPCPKPPPPTEQPCIRICPTEPPECPEPEYEIYKTDEGVCYIIKKGEKPHSPNDEKIASGAPSAEWISTLCEQCKPPEKPPSPGEPTPGIGVLSIPVPGCLEFGLAPGIVLPGGYLNLSRLIGLRKPDGTLNVPSVSGPAGLIINAILQGLAGFLASNLDQIGSVINSVISQSGCASGQQISLSLTAAALNALSTVVGDSLDFARVPLQQQRRFLCPTDLPSAADTAAAWLAGTVDDSTAECWIRAAGTRFPEYSRVIEGLRSKLSAFQTGTLRMRELIGDQEYATRMRETGFIRSTDPVDVLALLKQIPPPTDITRFMVRDTADEQLVQKFGMDDDFDLKFSGILKDWTRWQGIDDTYMRYFWRAHWSIPAPTQLFEMFHRLRFRADDDPAAVRIQDITEALKQQDILPYWIPKFLAISFRPLSRIDARRAFQIGAIDIDQLRDAWLDQGYSDDNAEILTRFTDRNRLLALLRSPWINRFATGEATLEDLTVSLQREGMREGDIPVVVDAAQRRLSAQRRKRCLASYRKRFLAGEFDGPDMISLLQSLGLSEDQISSITGGWECERSARGKEFGVGMLCKLLEDALIDSTDFVRRAERLGYNTDDAVVLYRSCARRLGIKQSLAEQRELQRATREQKAAVREAQAAERRRAADERRQVTLAEKAQRATMLRERRVIEAAKNYANRTAEDIVTALPWIRDLFRRLSRETIALTDEIIQVLVVVSQSKDVTDRASMEAGARAALTDLIMEMQDTNGQG